MVVGRSWRIKSTVTGKPTPDNFELHVEELGDLKVGDVLTKTLFITVDPYLRPLLTRSRLPIGSIIPSQQVGKVVESKDEEESGRISTVVFRCNRIKDQAEGYNGTERSIIWLNVHETWIQGKGGILKA